MHGNSNKAAIIMVQWKRQEFFHKTISYLNGQVFKNFDLFIWNNNQDYKSNDLLKNEIHNSNGYKIYIHNSTENNKGFGRFLMARKLFNNEIRGFKNSDYTCIIFLDDDIEVSKDFTSYLVENFEPKSYKGLHSFKIKNYDYKNRIRCKYGENADYVGTGVSVIDPEVFKADEFFDTYLYDEDVYWLEDIALTLYCKKIGWKTIGLDKKFFNNMFDKKDKNRNGQFKEMGGFDSKNNGYKKLKQYYLGK